MEYLIYIILFTTGLTTGIKLSLFTQLGVSAVVIVLEIIYFRNKVEGLAIAIPIIIFGIFGIGILFGDIAYFIQKLSS